MVLLDASTTRGAFAILSWYATNIFTVVLNKYLFQIISFTFPLTLTAIHMLICSIGSLVVLRILQVVPLIAIERRKLASHVVPLAAIFCLNIILGNISLRWIPVSFMQTVKSLVPAFTVVLQALFFQQFSPKMIYVSLIPVVGGVALASFTEVNFQIIGFAAALVASLTTSIQSIVSSMILTGPMRLDSINMVYYMAPISFVLILPVAFFYEYEKLLEYKHEEHGGFNYVVIVLLLSGTVAYLLNICTFFAIKSTSPLTFTVFGNLKVVVVIIISVLIFQNEINIMNGVGCLVAIVGIIWYNAIEYQLKEAKKKSMYRGSDTVPLDPHKKLQEETTTGTELEEVSTLEKTDD